MAIESERRFLVKSQEWMGMVERAVNITQGYLGAGKVVSRVRHILEDNQGFVTFKTPKIPSSGNKSISVKEFEYPIPEADALELLNYTTMPNILKVRHLIPFYYNEDFMYLEVDVFKNKELDNLTILEVELEEHLLDVLSGETLLKVLPNWVGDEITHVKGYSNFELSRKLVPSA